MNANARELAANFDIEKLTPEFYADPYPTYRALREHEPIKRLPNGSWFLTRYDDLATPTRARSFSLPTRKKSSCRNTAIRFSMSTTPPVSSSTTRPHTPGFDD
jgi:cytochrome P450